MHRVVGGSGFSDGAFTRPYGSQRNTLRAWNGYDVSFDDSRGHEIKISVSHRDSSEISRLDKLLKSRDFTVGRNYRQVLSSVRYVASNSHTLTIEVVPRRRMNEGVRTNSKDKLFNAIHNSAVKPILGAMVSC